MNNLVKMREKARDPNTPLTTLQTIAQDYPTLRPSLALNPSTYPDLLNWLRELNDPEINAALSERADREGQEAKPHQTDQEDSEDPDSNPPITQSAPVEDTPVDDIDITDQIIEVEPDDVPLDYEVDYDEEYELNENAEYEADYQEEPSAVSSPHPAAVTSPVPPPDSAMSARVAAPKPDTADLDSKGTARSLSSAEVARRRRTSFLVMRTLLGLIAVAITIGVIITNMGGSKRGSSADISVDSPTPITTGHPGTKAPASGTATVTELPPGYTGPVKTIEVPGAVPGQSIKKIVPDPEASAKSSASNSASPSTSASASPSATPTQTPTQTPTNPLAPADNAKTSGSFTTTDGNVRCVFAAGQVQCYANTIKAATNCETRQNDTGYTLVLSGSNTLQADCVPPQNMPTETTLQANETDKNGRFACKNSPAGNSVMCWDTKDGDGFVIGKNAVRRFGTGSKLPEFPG